MTQQGLYGKFAKYYDKIYDFKDYKMEAEAVSTLIKKHKLSTGNTLLDLGCGTAKHLQYLTEYECTGVDLSEELLEIAKANVPGAQFICADMRSFHTGEKYDIIISLFSSIGYLTAIEDLRKMILKSFMHLKTGGVFIFEPWISPELFSARTTLNTIEEEGNKIVRLISSSRKDNASVLDIHWLIAEVDQQILHFSEKHEMGLFSKETISEVLESENFKVTYRDDLLGRGLFIAQKIVV